MFPWKLSFWSVEERLCSKISERNQFTQMVDDLVIDMDFD